MMFTAVFKMRIRPFVLLALLLVSCARSPIKDVSQAMRATPPPKNIFDDIALVDLAEAIRKNIDHLNKIKTKNMRFGPHIVAKDDYVTGLEELIKALESDPSGQLFYAKLKNDFSFFEVYGDSKWGEVFITSYFEPMIKGRLKPQKPYIQPLYETPADMVYVQLDQFAASHDNFKSIYADVKNKMIRDGVLRGRVVKNSGGGPDQIVPYYTREEIEDSKKITKTAKIICYVDPVDAFFLQIQGSGRIELPSGKFIRVGYAAQNGYPYTAIGKLLFDVIPKEEMTAQKIESHLRSLELTEARKIMNQNKSYVFFRKLDSEPITYFGSEVVAGRTIATDPKYFPKGALAYIQYEEPVFKDAESAEVEKFRPSTRFVLDQDTGGAIRGPHRVDFFWGRGFEAARFSGVMRNPGRLYYILPKNSVR